MSKPKTAAELRLLEPRYTIGGLFESGTLGNADEEALNEIRALKSAFHRWVNPTRGWMSPRMSDSPPPVPRQLGHGPAWRRYTEWRRRWSFQVAPPSPNLPWGMTAAGLVVELVTEPASFNELAPAIGTSAFRLVELFVAAVRDYGRTVPAPIPRDLTRIWATDTDTDIAIYKSARVRPSRRLRNRWRKQKQRAKQKAIA